jgi:hypothetical protein
VSEEATTTTAPEPVKSKELLIKLPAVKAQVSITADWFATRDALLEEVGKVQAVKTAADFEAAGVLLKRVTGNSNGLETMRTEITAPFLAAQKTIKAASDKAREPLEVAKANLKKMMEAYAAEQQRLAAIEQKRLEAEAQALAEKEAAERAAAEEEFGPTEQETFQAPVVVAAPQVRVAHGSTVTVKSKLVFEVFEPSQVPRRFMIVDQHAIRAYMAENEERIRAMLEEKGEDGGMAFVSGVRFSTETKVSAR